MGFGGRGHKKKIDDTNSFEKGKSKVSYQFNSKNETKILLIFILKVFVKNAALNAPSNYIVFEITVFIAHVLNSNNWVLIKNKLKNSKCA